MPSAILCVYWLPEVATADATPVQSTQEDQHCLKHYSGPQHNYNNYRVRPWAVLSDAHICHVGFIACADPVVNNGRYPNLSRGSSLCYGQGTKSHLKFLGQNVLLFILEEWSCKQVWGKFPGLINLARLVIWRKGSSLVGGGSRTIL